jgi:large subunit ribosomal protein L15
MQLHELKPKKGSVRNNKRKGRGQGSGSGGTATRGHKGAKSRSGYSQKRNFEGGQTPLQMRVPKRGFNNLNRVEYKPINLADLERMASKFNVDSIDLEFLRKKNVIRKREKVKVLGNGKLERKLTVEANAVSASAKTAIEELGGSITIV